LINQFSLDGSTDSYEEEEKQGDFQNYGMGGGMGSAQMDEDPY
jgi:hypothetical protein